MIQNVRTSIYICGNPYQSLSAISFSGSASLRRFESSGCLSSDQPAGFLPASEEPALCGVLPPTPEPHRLLALLGHHGGLQLPDGPEPCVHGGEVAVVTCPVYVFVLDK